MRGKPVLVVLGCSSRSVALHHKGSGAGLVRGSSLQRGPRDTPAERPGEGDRPGGRPEEHSGKGPENDRQRRQLRAAGEAGGVAARASLQPPCPTSILGLSPGLARRVTKRSGSHSASGWKSGARARRSGVKRRGKRRSQASTAGDSLSAGRAGWRRPRRAGTSIVAGAGRPGPDSAVCPRPVKGADFWLRATGSERTEV